MTKWVLVVWSGLMFALALFILANAQSAIHEIEAGIAGIMATVAMTGVAIVETIASRPAK